MPPMKLQLARLLIASTVVGSMHAGAGDQPDRLDADWKALESLLQENYWRDVDTQALRRTCDAAASLALAKETSTVMSHEACVSAAIRVLDPRSRYITASETAEMDKPGRKFVGIGFELSRPRTPGPVRVVQPIPGSPSERAGLLPGDELYAIDDVDITPLAMSEFFQLIRGEPGTTITVRIRRGDAQEERVIAMQRAEIRVMRGRALFLRPQRVLWMRVSQFAGEATLQLAQSIEQALGASPVRPRRLIFDLRSNPGGLLEEALNTAALFLPEGTVVYEEISKRGTLAKKASELPQTVAARLPLAVRDELRQLPLTVLVDGHTASGAEMLAVALKDYRTARIVGRTTPGDNSITRRVRLPSGASVEMTNAKMTSSRGTDWTLGGVPLDEARDEDFAGSRREYGDPTHDKLLAIELNQ